MLKSLRNFLAVTLLASIYSVPVNAKEQWKHTLVPLYLWGGGIEGPAIPLRFDW